MLRFGAVALLALVLTARGEEDAAAEPAAEGAEENDETKKLISQLTIAMIGDVIDERTFELRDSGKGPKGGRTVLRLGNTAPPEQNALSDEDFAKKLEASKEALKTLLGKQMVWWKAAPDEVQTDDGKTVGDAWFFDGRHVNTAQTRAGHLIRVEEYQSDIAKDILQAAAEKDKQESYKKLEEALKESQKESKRLAQEEAKKRQQEREEEVEPIGTAGWLGIAMVLLIIVGVATNFGKDRKKKVNLNKKKGPLEQLWKKVKGS